MNRKQKQIINILIILGVLLGLVFTGGFQQRIFQAPGAIIAISKIEIKPEGYLEENKIRGGYLVITGAVQYSEDWQILKFDNETLKENPVYRDGKRVWVKNKIEIRFKPYQPYFRRDMVYKSSVVVPEAYKCWMNKFTLQAGESDEVKARPLYSEHWEFSTSDWRLFVPIQLNVLVNDQIIAVKDLNLLDIEQQSLGHSLDVSTSRGVIQIQSLGALQGGYYPPEWGNIIYFSDKYFYLDSSAIRQAIDSPYPWPYGGGDGVLDGDYKSTYAYYWYGGTYDFGTWGVLDFNRYWTDSGRPYPFASPVIGTYLGIDDKAPGWVSRTDSLNLIYEPLPAPKFPEDKNDLLPEEKRGALSLTEFLERRGAQKPAMPSWLSSMKVALNTFGQPELNRGAMYLYLPWGSFSHLITVTIPTELVDAVVEVPKLANLKITDFPEDLGEIATEKTFTFKLKQLANVTSDGIVELTLLEPATTFMAFYPNWFGTGPMAPNEEKSFEVRVINLGSPKKMECSAKIEVKNTLGVVTDVKTFKFVLLPRQGKFSLLTVRVRTEEGLPVNGILVVVSYEGHTKEAYTSEGSVTFDFEGATPTVTISTRETEVYHSASTTYQMHEGFNEVTLTLSRKGAGSGIDWGLIMWVLLAGIIIIIIFIVYKKRGRFKT